MTYDFFRFIRDPEPWTIPKPLPGPIVTERLEVRRWQPGDGPKLFDAVQGDRASLLPWMVWALRDHRTVDESIHYVESQMREVADPACRNFNVGFFERPSGVCVGGGGWAFRRIHVQCLAENVASKRVCEKLGLRLELQSKQAKYLAGESGGRYYDLLGYAVLAGEWDLSGQHGICAPF